MSGISDLTAALLSKAAYTPLSALQNNQAVSGLPGWQVVTANGMSGSSTDGTAQFMTFVNGTTHQAVIAFRGTDTSSLVNAYYNLGSDLNNTAATMYSSISAAAQTAITNIRSTYSGYEIMTDGHSAGGGMAQTFSVINNLGGYGQNSLPISPVTISGDSNFSTQFSLWQQNHTFSEVNTDGDLATKWYQTLPIQSGQNPMYLDPSPTVVPGPYQTIETFGYNLAQNGGVSAVVGNSISAWALLQAHSIDTVINNLPNVIPSSSQGVSNLGLLFSGPAGTTSYSNYYGSFNVNSNGLGAGTISFYDATQVQKANLQYFLVNGSGPVCTITDPTGAGSVIANGQMINFTAQSNVSVPTTDSSGNTVITVSPKTGTAPAQTFTISNDGVIGNNADGLPLSNINVASDGSYTNYIASSDSIASTTYDVFGRPTSGLQTFTDGSHIDTSYSTVSSNTWISRQNIYDSNNNLIGSTTFNKDYTTDCVQIDPATNAKYYVSLDAQGNPIPGSSSFTAGTASQPSAYAKFTSAVIDTLATQLITQVLIKNNLPASIAATAFASATIKSATGVGSTGNFNLDFANSVVGIAGGIGGSTLGALVAKNLGLPTQVGSLVGGIGGNLLTQAVVNEASEAMGLGTLTSVTFADSAEMAGQFSSGLAGAGGGLLGTYLGGLVSGNTSADAQIGGAVGGAAGGVIGSLIPVIGTFIGALIGSFIGDLIGGLFDTGSGKPFVQGEIAVVNGQFQVIGAAEDNGSNIQDAYAIGNSISNYLNQILGTIGGTATSSQSWWVGYHAERGFSFQAGQTAQYFSNLNDAVQYATYNLLRSVQISGGNPMMVWELQNSTATNISDLLSDLGIAQNYQLISTTPLAVQTAVAASGDITQYQNLQNQVSLAQTKGLNRLSYDGTTLTITTTAAQITGDLNTLGHMQGTSYKFAFADTGANILSNLSMLEAQAVAGHLVSVSATDTTPPTLSFSVTQVTSNIDALKLLKGSFVLKVTDTAANVVANLATLQTLASVNALTSIILTGTGTQTLSISALQLLNDATALNKITTAYNYAITDTAANISNAFANLVTAQAGGHLLSVTTTDAGTAVLKITVDQATNQTATLAKFTKAYNYTLVDTGAHIATNLAGWQTNAASGKLVSITLTDPTTANISVTLAQTTSYSTVLSMLSGQATLNVTGVQPNVTTTIPGTGFTIPLAVNDTVQGVGTNTYTSSLSGKPVAVTLTNTKAVVDASGNVTFTTPLTGFGSSVLRIGTNGTATLTLGSDVLTFQNNALQSVSYSNGAFNFGVVPTSSTYAETITWNPTTGLANLVITPDGKSPITTSLGQVNPGTAFIVNGSTITNTNASAQKLLSTSINTDGTQVDTTYNYAGGTNKDTAITLNTDGKQTSIRYDHTDGSSYTTFTNPANQAVIANLTINVDGSGSISTANNQTVTFAKQNVASASTGTAGDILLTLKTASGTGITETIDLSNGQIASVINSNSLIYTLANAGASVDASGNVTITGGGSTLVLPANGSNATFTVGTAVLPFPQSVLQSVSSVNGAYQFGLVPSAYGFAETLTWNPTTGVMNLLMTPAGGSPATTSLGLFNPGDILSISGPTISTKTSTGTAKSSTTINPDGSQSNTFNNGAGALHVASDGTTVFVYGSDQLTFKPNVLLSSTSSGGIFTFNITTPSSAYTESVTWNPTTGMANLVLTASGKSPVTTSLGQVNPGTVFMVSGATISNTNASAQLLQSTTINPDGSQTGTVYAYTGTIKDTITALNNSGQQTSIRWDHTDGTSYTSFTNPANQAVIANFSLNADGSGYVATNNNQTINFATHNIASVSIGTAGDTILTIKTQSGITETLDLSSGKIVSTVNGNALTYTLASAGASIDASGNTTITGGGSTILIPANGSNALFKVGQDSLSFPQNALQTLSSVSGVYMFGVTSSVTGYNETISWNPANGMANLILTPTAGGTAITTSIGQINPGNVLTISGNILSITSSTGSAIVSNEIYLDGSQLNIFHNNTATVNETVTSINAAGQTTSVRWDNHDGSQYTSYYVPATGAILANRQVNADGSGYVATANNHTVTVAAGNVFKVSSDSSGNPLVTINNLSGNQLTQTLDVQASQIASTINGRTLTYVLPNPSISYDGSGNLTLVSSGSTLVLPANGSNYNFSVGQDTISLDPASTTVITPNGVGYNFTLVSAAGAGTSEYVNWNPQTGIATLNMVAANGTNTQTNMGYIDPGFVLKVNSIIITNTNASGQVIGSYAVEGNGSVVSTALNSTTTYAASNSLLGLATGVTASITGSGDTIFASTGDAITNTGNAANTYVYGSGFGTQTLNNAGTTTGSAKGSLQFSPGITDENLWLKQVGNNLEIDQIGTTNKITISGWFTNASSQVSNIQTKGDGLKLDSGVVQLLSAMATYSSSHSGFNPTTAGTAMPTDTALQNAIAASWHR